MVSKLRVLLLMLLLTIMAGGLIALLVSWEAGRFWVTTMPVLLIAGGATAAHSAGLLNKADKD